MSLRPYQRAGVTEVLGHFAAGVRSVVYVGATGSGKTHTASSIIAEWAGPVLFLAHLDAIVGDTAARLRAAGVSCGIIAPWAPAEPQHRVQVASLGTIHARGLRPTATLVIADECQHAKAVTVEGILLDYPEAFILGLTATPQRGDGQALGDVFQRLVLGPSVRELTAMGALVPAHMVVTVDEGKRGDAVAELRRLPGAWRALVFCESREEARYTVERLTDAGHPAGYIDGDTPRKERERLRVALRRRELHALVGVSVFVEGFDEPSVDVVALDAAFGTLGRYLQAIGRGLRAHPGKTHCTVLDVRGAVFQHLPPDVEHEWSLTGEAVTQRLAGLAFSRCEACWAVFPRAKVCPRCGVSALVKALPMRRIQAAARMAKLESMPADQRRARYHAGLVHIGVSRRRMSPERAKRWADEECARRFP